MPKNLKMDFDMSVVWPNLISKESFMEDAMDWISNNLNPEDVFSAPQLEKWAESEGYVKQSETE